MPHNKLIAFCKEHGVKQKQLADALGWGKSRLNNYVKGQRSFTPEIQKEMVDALKILGVNCELEIIFNREKVHSEKVHGSGEKVTGGFFGATPEDWQHFDLILGLTDDLLPVVSNPSAVISPNSSMKTLGKTPSRYNANREVVGFPAWTTHLAAPVELEAYMKERDYGICVQTRHLRAIDVDIDDAALAARVHATIKEQLNIDLPVRRRFDSSKFLLVAFIPGGLTKRILKTEHGAIEFLATGQQFIAVGQHPSGARYEWPDGLPVRVPALDIDTFNVLWSTLESQFGTEASITLGDTKQRIKRAADAGARDDVTDYLDDKGITIDAGHSGERHIECPFKAEHTSDSGPTSTTYFPAGTGGFEQGHFRCLHAHCSHRTDNEFLDAIGYSIKDFDIILPEPGEKPLPPFKRDKNGAIEPTADNFYKAILRPDICGVEIRFDQFKDEIMLSPPNTGGWRSFSDEDYTRLQIQLERRDFKNVSREGVRHAVGLVAKDRPFDSAIDWLNGLEWDGVPRVESFITDYFNAEDSEYIRAVSRYMWTALAGRVLVPGVKADMVPIFVGEQGMRKSSAIAALVPDPAFFTEISFAEKDDDLARKTRGKLVAEIGELRGLHTKELESIKAFITRTHENWVPKFKEFATQFPRRLVFFGTTNKSEFLADETGNRRWLPVDVTFCDVDRLKRNALLLWAEGRELFNANGVEFKEAERLAESVHEAYSLTDPWDEIIYKWLHEPDYSNSVPATRGFLRMSEVLQDAIGLDAGRVSRREELRAGKSMRTCGFTRVVRRIDGRLGKVWVKNV